jgi:hypothetical protein
MRRVISFWVLSLAVAAGLASAVTAQVTRAPLPRVVSGNDIGFRVEGTNPAGKPVGTWVVRINGDWVEAATTMKAAPATTR